MDKEKIKAYISKYKDSYSKEAISKQLIASGATQEEIDSVWNKGAPVSSDPETAQSPTQQPEVSSSSSKHSPAPLVWGLLGFFIPVLGFIFAIIAIVKGSKARKIDKTDGYALAGKILGWVTVILYLLSIGFTIFVMPMMYENAQNSLLEDINTQVSVGATGGDLTVDRVEGASAGSSSNLYINNPGSSVEVTSLTLSVGAEEVCSITSPIEVSNGLNAYLVPCSEDISPGDKVEVLLQTERDIVELTKTVR
ncbi:MAG: DUF4190 domain-containing protein [Nanoarchaeota archaeon]